MKKKKCFSYTIKHTLNLSYEKGQYFHQLCFIKRLMRNKLVCNFVIKHLKMINETFCIFAISSITILIRTSIHAYSDHSYLISNSEIQYNFEIMLSGWLCLRACLCVCFFTPLLNQTFYWITFFFTSKPYLF